MNLSIKDGVFYVDNLRFCLAGVGNGRPNFEFRSSEVGTAFSHAFQEVLPCAFDSAWIGADERCDIILGRIHKGNGFVPCHDAVKRLVSMVEQAESSGERVTLCCQ